MILHVVGSDRQLVRDGCHACACVSDRRWWAREGFHVERDASQLFCLAASVERPVWRCRAGIALGRWAVALRNDRRVVRRPNLTLHSVEQARPQRYSSLTLRPVFEYVFRDIGCSGTRSKLELSCSATDKNQFQIDLRQRQEWAERSTTHPQIAYGIGWWGFRSHEWKSKLITSDKTFYDYEYDML